MQKLVLEIFKHWEGSWIKDKSAHNFQESKILHLQIDKAYKILGWKPKWCFEKTVERTISWYKNIYINGLDPEEACSKDINKYIVST